MLIWHIWQQIADITFVTISCGCDMAHRKAVHTPNISRPVCLDPRCVCVCVCVCVLSLSLSLSVRWRLRRDKIEERR